jgi:hypothetical protein
MGDRTKLRNLVRLFSAAMRLKLLYKHDRGWENWDAPAFREKLVDDLMQHLVRAIETRDHKKWIDVANYAAFLWYHDGKVQLNDEGR